MGFIVSASFSFAISALLCTFALNWFFKDQCSGRTGDATVVDTPKDDANGARGMMYVNHDERPSV